MTRAGAGTAAILLAGLAVARDPSPAFARGRHVYEQVCSACHQPDGLGLLPVFPPLAGSDYLMADKERSIDVVLNGISGRIHVNGLLYDGVMPRLELGDDDIAGVLTYVRNSFGNSGDSVTPAEVKARRARSQAAASER